MHIPRIHHHNVRALPALVDRHADQLQAAADDEALARDERNEAIAERVTFDVLPFSAEQIAVIDAALRRGWIEDREMFWNTCQDVLKAEITRRIAAADHAESRPLVMTYCSQCGAEMGSGISGVSHCSDHRIAPPHLLRSIRSDQSHPREP
ncbi:hypothetical protein SB394_02680 [Burkholderia sp. BCCIQ04A]|uniref:C2H2-type domain-containing protein n=1 Tax=Burkholderia anthinoferrum TaxID=3090833 RepID=A0ABU5WU51_9BURK|nr:MULTISPECIES: hypothetical protein [Burkholderia]MEB2535871.1 hypothetical protein [Burkholderia anthinoferrum]MEB2561999.1 hypothetical protein [Burkholderia anthinoferrum]MEB2582300.1 hypothetical protein [Burkholderia anthinoferrum]MDF3115846.1 hypothetical protein [Burkholderia semiarida]MEB2632625.1 hypothetical protein [Burkholderia anthinoferrum]